MTTSPTTHNNAVQAQDDSSSSLSAHYPVVLATLRRSSSHVTPTRTLVLSELEHRHATPPVRPVLSPLELASRPRSNQRTRTPRRYESPMDPNAFRRHGGREEGEVPQYSVVSTDRGTTDRTARTSSEALLSRKQGPSHRKVRRWRNDHFDDLAAQMDNGAAAEALRRAKDKAHLYRDVVNFRDMSPDPLTRFIKDDKLQGVRDKFFECELPVPTVATLPDNHNNKSRRHHLSAQEKLFRVDARLRRVVTKACRNSQPAAMVVRTLENFVMATFGATTRTTLSNKKKSVVHPPTGQWWTTLLSEQPTVTARRDGQYTVQFLFDAASPTGGFHRLLLHAVCQYHGLHAVSKMVDIGGKTNRALIVTGQDIRHKHTMLAQLIDDADQVEMLEEPWTLTEKTSVAEEGGWAVIKS